MACRPQSFHLPSRRGLLLGGAVLALGVVPGWAVEGWAQDRALAVTVIGDLPGFQPQAAAPFLAIVMNTAGKNTPGGGQTFFAADGAAPDRVEWTFRPNPYAGGASRTVGPPRSAASRLFGVHRVLSVELRLYRDGRYQTEVFGQAEVQGGRRDAELQTFVSDMTRRLLDAAAQ
ncbi:hypothetical protein UCD39_11160 [Nitrospirillum sp. BR 11752]|uniref:hypothetical protein n=1 Tax=Nitrospirillum sp. BR 11752 TaxID=3104293 RepID=UPI002ECD9CC0|nr:hypothetical protein [Nitrospirillum sp. BR 11752]